MAGNKNPFAKFLKHFESGHVLFKEGEEGEDMYIIQSGRVAIKKKVGEGDTTLAILEKGDFFGEMSILERLPRSASAEIVESGDLIVISGEIFGDMIKANPEIAVRMLRKYSIRLRETNRQIEQMLEQGIRPPAQASKTSSPAPAADAASVTIQGEALAYFISTQSGNVFPIFKPMALLGRFDSVTGMQPDVDLTNEDHSRNISRRHARVVLKNGTFFVAEEIGTMNGTFLNGEKLVTGVLTPIKDKDELVLCRLPLKFKVGAVR
ncbi:MAG: cyclic nucleotide-binding domain-containing protein [Vicinamibacteria bacterium]|nr:cyclic nucleotide-binding domain-containing protein [Vicinamibacteria bacterium]